MSALRSCTEVASNGGRHPDAHAAELERWLRQFVAERLGLGIEELAPPVSLVDGLAVDSLDLVELALDIEEALDVSLPERLLVAVRTYGDLAALVIDLVDYPVSLAEEPVLVRARVVLPGAGLPPGRDIVRVLVLTPYALETIAEDVRRTGQGARVEVRIPGDSRERRLMTVRAMFGGLAASGIEVDVGRDEEWR